ncbi:MAG TPA: TldD/PmbA family protein, partial [Halanaerobiales bacterium]|nr:TldD/PmbA family protein [Halanaerobiales bacterium]
RVLKDGAFGYASTNVLTAEEIDRVVDSALTIAKASPEDPANYLPDAAEIKYIEGLVDDKNKKISLAEMLKYGQEAVSAMLEHDPRVKIDSAHFGARSFERVIVNSRGIEAREEKTVFEGVCMAFAREGELVSSFDAFLKSSCKLADTALQKEARELADRVISSLNAETINSFKGSVILSPDAVLDIIVSPVFSAVNGDNVINGVSPWNGRIGDRVVSKQISIIDNARIAGGVGSRAFDREGVPTGETAVITDGVLETYLHNCYTARKMEVKPTGHAGGSDRGVGISPSNFIIQPGRESLKEIIKTTSKGLLVNRFSGNVDSISGDFSGIVKGGSYIDSGEKVKPVKEIMIAGNIYQLLNNISAISSNTKNISAFTVPYIKLEDVSVTGK